MPEDAKPWYHLDLSSALQIALVAGGVCVWAIGAVNKTDATTAAVIEFRSDVRSQLDHINSKLDSLPAQQEHIAQLDVRVRDSQSLLSLLDGRTHALAGQAAAIQADINNLKTRR